MSPVGSPLVINAGKSLRGWSFRSRALFCAQDWAYGELLPRSRNDAEPLVKGSLVHTGLAHYRVKLMADQQGWSWPEMGFAEPFEAIAEQADEEDHTRHELGLEPYWRGFVPLAQEVVSKRTSWDIGRVGTVIAVERLLSGWFTEDRMVDPPADAERRLALIERTAYGPLSERIEAFRELGHLGAPYLHTARADWIEQDAAGYYWIVDTKTAYKLSSIKLDGYTLSGQLLGLHWFGAAAYGEKFGGIALDYAVLIPPIRFERERPRRNDRALQSFPATVAASERRILALVEEYGAQLDDYPKAFDEQACARRYGRCPWFNWCRIGRPGVDR